MKKNKDFNVGNIIYSCETETSAIDGKPSKGRTGIGCIYEKDNRSSRCFFDFFGTYLHNDDIFTQSLFEYLQNYLSTHTLKELQQHIKNNPKIRIADIEMNFSSPQWRCDIFPLNNSSK